MWRAVLRDQFSSCCRRHRQYCCCCCCYNDRNIQVILSPLLLTPCLHLVCSHRCPPCSLRWLGPSPLPFVFPVIACHSPLFQAFVHSFSSLCSRKSYTRKVSWSLVVWTWASLCLCPTGSCVNIGVKKLRKCWLKSTMCEQSHAASSSRVCVRPSPLHVRYTRDNYSAILKTFPPSFQTWRRRSNSCF